jgi:hypothetical protein
MLPRATVIGLYDEMAKLGAVSDEQARRSLDRYDALEKARPTAGQVGRYGALGAGAGALSKTISTGIEHGRLPTGRAALGAAAAGAVGMGAVPLIRGALDRHAEKRTLGNYLKQEHVGSYAPNAPAMTDAQQPTTGLSR